MMKSVILKELNIPAEQLESIRKQSIESIQIFDFTKNLLNQLSKDYLIGIISNNSKEWGEDILKKNNIKDYFKIIIFSHEVGLAKPDKKIYELAFSKLKNISPQEILFIDDKEKSLIPAREEGWNTILFHSYEQLITDLKKFLGQNTKDYIVEDIDKHSN